MIGNTTSIPLTVPFGGRTYRTVTARIVEPRDGPNQRDAPLIDTNGRIVGMSTSSRLIAFAGPNPFGGDAIILEASDLATLVPGWVAHNEVGWDRPSQTPAVQPGALRLLYGDQEMRVELELRYQLDARYAGAGLTALICEPGNRLFVDPFGTARSRFPRWPQGV